MMYGIMIEAVLWGVVVAAISGSLAALGSMVYRDFRRYEREWPYRRKR